MKFDLSSFTTVTPARLRRTLLALGAGLLLTPLAAPASSGTLAPASQQGQYPAAAALEQPAGQFTSQLRPKIQVALLLDTSNSMDGLIDQTRNQLWQVVNEFASARQNGVAPILEIALFEYGNNGISRARGHVRMLNTFTRELDRVSEGLFSLTTNGGNEYCGYALRTAIEQLQWSGADADLRTIFIAGNEPFTQGPVNFHDAVRLAKRDGITINTIHAGGYQLGVDSGWQAGALLAGGDYMSIDANRPVAHLQAPQDARIAELNARLNQTYIPYGHEGAASLERQLEQDVASEEISPGLLAQRAGTKSSMFYSNSGWDLVDAIEQAESLVAAMIGIDDEALPQPLAGLSTQQKLDYVRRKAAERAALKLEITRLSREREAFVAASQAEMAASAPSIGDALTRAVRKQAQAKNFVFEK